jgi:ferredoxin, 2Fe-2S
MPEITFILQGGERRTVEAPENWSVLQIALEHKIAGLEGVCGGAMACSTCHVWIHPDWVSRVTREDNEQTDEERDILDLAFHVRETSRLGCQIKVNEALDGLVVALPGTGEEW